MFKKTDGVVEAICLISWVTTNTQPHISGYLILREVEIDEKQRIAIKLI